jgi:hypothetical protein
MKKVLILFLGAIAFTNLSQAQSAVTASPLNTEYAKKFDGVAGNFTYALNSRENLNINYSFSPLHPADVAHFMVHTPDPMPFWATVSNSSGKVVYTWKPEQKVYLYKTDWNLSKLGSGEYTVNIYLETDKKSIYQFKFTK